MMMQNNLHFLDRKIIEINTNNLIHNYKIIKKRSSNAEILCVVKGDAYGHGLIECSSKLYSHGVKNFYVARIDDAIRLRNQFKSINIYLLAGVISRSDTEEIFKKKIIPIINNFEQLQLIKKIKKSPIKFVIHADTGMNRLGFQNNEMDKLFQSTNSNQILSIISHLSSSDEKNEIESLWQLKQLKLFNRLFQKPLSLCNSAGIFLNKKLHLDFVRPGKSLYGINPFPGKTFDLKPVMSIYAPILQVSKIKRGVTVGYAKTFKAKKNMKIATVDFGYSDGLHRIASNKGKVFIDDLACPILGRISMDLITIDVSHIDQNKLYLGRPVEILGKNQSYESLANDNLTNEHEILISLGKNSKKYFLD